MERSGVHVHTGIFFIKERERSGKRSALRKRPRSLQTLHGAVCWASNNSNFHHQTYNMPSATIKENAELIIVVDADAMVDTSK